MKKTYNTYKKSGVNMATADKLVNYISKISRKTHKKNTEIKSVMKKVYNTYKKSGVNMAIVDKLVNCIS